MKKMFMVLIALVIMFINIDVFAKDSVYTLNKFGEEEYKFILNDKSDFVVAGTYLKEVIKEDEEEYNDNQVMIVKYDKNNDIVWKYAFGSTMSDDVFALNYHYDEELNVDGYLVTVLKAMTKEEEKLSNPYFLVLDRDGNNINEIDSLLESNINVREVINTYNDEGIINGYLLIGDNNNYSVMAKYDLELNLLWKHDIKIEDNNIISELVYFNNNYIAILKDIASNSYKLVKLDLDGNYLSTIKDDFEKNDCPRLFANDNTFIVYGYTEEVKIENKAATSYYLISYNDLDEVLWDTIGNDSVDSKKIMKLVSAKKDSELSSYNLMYINAIDNSIEVVNINIDGTIGSKIKKIKNNYYRINDFITKKDVIYFIGQIECPIDDTCDYDSSCLFLVSDENKVIEVKDSDSKNILIFISGFIILAYLVIFYVKKKRN